MTNEDRHRLAVCLADLKAKRDGEARTKAARASTGSLEEIEYDDELRSILSEFTFEDDRGYGRAPSRAELETIRKRRAEDRQNKAGASELTQRMADVARKRTLRQKSKAPQPSLGSIAEPVARSVPQASQSVLQASGVSGVPDGTRRSEAVFSNAVQSMRKRLPLIRPRGEVLAPHCSLNALRVAVLLPFYVHARHDHDFLELATTVYGLSKAIGLNYTLNRTQAELLLDEVQRIVFRVRDGQIYKSIVALPTAELDHSTGHIRLRLNSDLAPYLLDRFANFRQQGNYRKVRASIFGLRQARALQLYFVLCQFPGLATWIPHGQRWHQIPFDQICDDLGIARNTSWRTFRKDVLGPAIAEIVAKTELRIDFRPVRPADRKRGGVTFVAFRCGEDKGKLQGSSSE